MNTFQVAHTKMLRERREQHDILDLIRDHLFRGPMEHEYDDEQLIQLFDRAEQSLKKQPTLLELQGPIHICGDIHGQYQDLLQIFHDVGAPYKTRYLFLGDYVDRGRYSLEVLVLLMACKVQFPDRMYLIRGNHEIASVNKQYGFYAELRMRFHSQRRWQRIFDKIGQVFAQMPVAATVNGKILCMHGGISPKLESLDDIRKITRPIDEPTGLVEDILWSDPGDECMGFTKNDERGCSFVFGVDAIEEKCKKLGISLIVRGHQMVDRGYEYFAKRRVVTVFSAPGYNENYENLGAVMRVTADNRVSFHQFAAAADIVLVNPRLRNVIVTDN